MKFTAGDRVMPDLAFGLASARTEGDVMSATNDSRLRVGVNPIPYFYLHHWPETNAKLFGLYFKKLVLFVASLLKDGHEVVLFATDSPDYIVMDLLLDQLTLAAGSGKIGAVSVLNVASTGELLTELRTFDCAVVSRLHAAILSHICVKAVLAISYDRKVTQYMADMEQSRYCLDINNTQLEELKRTFGLLRSSQAEIKSIVRRKNEEWCSRLALQYDEVMQYIKKNCFSKNAAEVVPLSAFK
jgi:polysaccharide pyruvyl transferase WcaK-like protein